MLFPCCSAAWAVLPAGHFPAAISKREESIMLRFALIALTLSLAQPALAQEKIKVVATFSILADFVKNVGGERVEVRSVVGANSDAHLYQPTPADAKTLGDAKVVFVNGYSF